MVREWGRKRAGECTDSKRLSVLMARNEEISRKEVKKIPDDVASKPFFLFLLV